MATAGGAMDKPAGDDGGLDWLEAELADTLDEDYELEISEPALSMEIAQDLHARAIRPRSSAAPTSASCSGSRPS